jgi:hypothetical protein
MRFGVNDVTNKHFSDVDMIHEFRDAEIIFEVILALIKEISSINRNSWSILENFREIFLMRLRSILVSMH